MSINPFYEHKANLKNYDFWSSVEEEEYNVTIYDELLCKKKVINKQTCHNYLTADIQYILEHFSENVKLLYKIKSLQNKLKNARKDEMNLMFWSDIAPKFMRVNYEKPAVEAELMNIAIQKAIDLINASTSTKLKTDQFLETRNKKQKKEENASYDMEQVEHDGLYVGKSDISVGTIIKRAALQYFHESKIRKLSPGERKIMTNGLSSILDLVDQSSSSQKSLFSNEAWNQITSQFESELSLKLLPLPRILTNIWLIISGTVVSTNQITLGSEYVNKIYSNHNIQDRRYLKLFEHVLNLIETYPHMLKKDGAHKSDYSESDVLRIIWSPIFELLFPSHQHNLIVKTGKTSSFVSPEHKQDTYDDSSNILAFKIGIRVIYQNHGKEIDLVCGEVAKNDEDSRMISDKGKLSRETKDAVDSIVMLVGTSIRSFGVEISGSTCLITTQQLVRNGLYVYYPAYSLSLPSCLQDLETFESTMQRLVSFQQHVITVSNILDKAEIKKYSLNH